MKTIPLVKDEEAALARKMEAKLLSLPREAGILFVGVTVHPSIEQAPPVYTVWVGCSRDFEESMFPYLVRVTLRDLIPLGTQLEVQAHRGVCRRA